MPLSLSSNRIELGRQAEAAARDHLIAQGLEIVAENFRCRRGELDLVAFDGKVLAVIEVRLRTQIRYVDAAASVGPRKQARIIAATQYLLLTRPRLRRFAVRFDVVTLDRATPQDPLRIEWIRDAFQA